MRKFMVALTFLTIFPAGTHLFHKENELSEAAVYFPLVGAALGLFLSSIVYLLQDFVPPGPLVMLIFMAILMITRGLHLDGLADTADGLAGGMKRDRALAIMHDSAVGPMGAGAVVLVYLFKYSALLAASSNYLPLLIFGMLLCGRWCIVLAGAACRPAKEEGMGNWFIKNLGPRQAFGASLISGVIILLFGHYQPLSLLMLLAGISLALLGTLIFTVLVLRFLGGLTGDTLGAINEVAEVCFLLGALLWWSIFGGGGA